MQLDLLLTVISLAGAVYAFGRYLPLGLAWLHRTLLPPLVAPAPPVVMSRSAVLEAPAQKPVSPDTYQAEPPSEPVVSGGTEPVRNQRARLLAAWREEDGTYSLSANRIAEIVGGQRAEVLAAVREVRGAPEPPYNPDKHLLVNNGERWIER